MHFAKLDDSPMFRQQVFILFFFLLLYSFCDYSVINAMNLGAQNSNCWFWQLVISSRFTNFISFAEFLVNMV